MSVRLTGAPREAAVRPVSFGPGRDRKIAFIGGGPTRVHAPWDDPSWVYWAHSSVYNIIPRGRADVLFDVHPEHVFKVDRKNGFASYYGFLRLCRTPIYMQQQYPAIPASIRYPIETIKAEWPTVPFGSSFAFMMALALQQGATTIGIFGCEFAHGAEWQDQRANAERWVGIAEGRGVRIVNPPDNPFLHEPAEDYGYESHSTPEKYQERLRIFEFHKKRLTGKPDVTKTVETLLDLENAAKKRAETQFEWVKQVGKFEANELAIPDEILQLEEQQRRDARAEAVRLAEERSREEG